MFCDKIIFKSCYEDVAHRKFIFKIKTIFQSIKFSVSQDCIAYYSKNDASLEDYILRLIHQQLKVSIDKHEWN